MNYVPDLVSFLTVTIDRYELTSRIIKQNLQRCSWPHVELLSTDNGSADRRVPQYVASLEPYYHRLNKENVGYSIALNQMVLRSRGEFICLVDPDIELPPGWLNCLVSTYRILKKDATIKPGVSGFWSVLDHYPVKQIAGLTVEPGNNVFGMKFYHRELLKLVGCYPETFGRYGAEDNWLNHCCNMNGYTNYYVPGVSVHLGDDAYTDSPYRKMKWDELSYSMKVYRKLEAEAVETGNYFTSPPEKRFLAHPSHQLADPEAALTTIERCQHCHCFGWNLERYCMANPGFKY